MKILKIGATWCSGCLIMKPRFKEIESELTWLKTEYFDYDVDREKILKYNIVENLPVFIFLDSNDNEFLRLSGEISKKELVETILKNKDK